MYRASPPARTEGSSQQAWPRPASDLKGSRFHTLFAEECRSLVAFYKMPERVLSDHPGQWLLTKGQIRITQGAVSKILCLGSSAQRFFFYLRWILYTVRRDVWLRRSGVGSGQNYRKVPWISSMYISNGEPLFSSLLNFTDGGDWGPERWLVVEPQSTLDLGAHVEPGAWTRVSFLWSRALSTRWLKWVTDEVRQEQGCLTTSSQPSLDRWSQVYWCYSAAPDPCPTESRRRFTWENWLWVGEPLSPKLLLGGSQVVRMKDKFHVLLQASWEALGKAFSRLDSGGVREFHHRCFHCCSQWTVLYTLMNSLMWFTLGSRCSHLSHFKDKEAG